MTDLDSYFLRLEWEYEDQQEEQELIYREEMEYMAAEYLLHSQEL
jgi:hypothetical protein